MEYNKLASVTGLTGLFELISTKADGAVVRSLEDNTSKFVSNRIHSFSHLESIEIFTVKENVNLVHIFLAMKDSKEKQPDANDAKKVKAYFEIVYPDMDFARVYASDMKKMVKWFDILEKNKIEIKLSDTPTEEVETTEKPVAEKKSSKTAAPKTAAVKTAPPKKINTPRKMA